MTYKIVLLVAVFAFALQSANGSPVADKAAENAAANAGLAKEANAVANPEAAALAAAAEGDTTPPPSSTPASTTPKTSGASGSEICVLLVQISSLALVAKHVML